MNPAFIKLPNGRFINMALVADVVTMGDSFLNLYPAGCFDKSPVPTVSLPLNSPESRAVLDWLEGHRDFAETP